MQRIDIETAWDEAEMPHLVLLAASAVAGMASIGRRGDMHHAALSLEVGREAFGSLSGDAQTQLLKIATVFLSMADQGVPLAGFGASEDPQTAAAVAEAMARRRAGEPQN